MSLLGKTYEVYLILKRALEWPELVVCPEFVSYNITEAGRLDA